MLNIVLYQPEIPPNTGNIIRLAANMGARLHLIKPYGFELSEKQCRRAGLDYKNLMNLYEYDCFADFESKYKNNRIFIVSTKVKTPYSKPNFQDEDVFLFGSETKGLPSEIHKKFTGVTIPMVKGSRSLNLSNSVAIVLYEAWRQIDFNRQL
jgi:tRNA (cytidine/uridine-2'-O-)-methyltransferase